MQRSGRVTCAALMVFTMSFAGCLSSGSSSSQSDSIPDWDKDMIYVDNPMGHSDARYFEVSSPFSNQSWGNSSWAVFGNEEGVIAVNTILRPPKKAGFSILVASIQLGQKIEVTLGRNIAQVYYLR